MYMVLKLSSNEHRYIYIYSVKGIHNPATGIGQGRLESGAVLHHEECSYSVRWLHLQGHDQWAVKEAGDGEFWSSDSRGTMECGTLANVLVASKLEQLGSGFGCKGWLDIVDGSWTFCGIDCSDLKRLQYIHDFTQTITKSSQQGKTVTMLETMAAISPKLKVKSVWAFTKSAHMETAAIMMHVRKEKYAMQLKPFSLNSVEAQIYFWTDIYYILGHRTSKV